MLQIMKVGLIYLYLRLITKVELETMMVIGFFVDYVSKADKFFFVEYASQADIIIFFVDYSSRAGLNKKEKIQLFY